MENLREVIQGYKEDTAIEVNHITHKLEQKSRNRIKREMTEALMKDLEGLADDFIVTRVEKGVGIAVLTPEGYIPATIEITMKSIDLDVQMAASEYSEKLAIKEAKKAESNAAKLEKIQADAIKREKKRAERAAKEAAKLESLQSK